MGEIRRQAQRGGVHQGTVDTVGTAHQILLGDETDVVHHVLIFFVHIPAVEDDFRLGLFIAVDGIQVGRFSGAGTTQQQHHVARLDIHMNIPKKVFRLKKIAGGAFFEVDGETLIHDFRL